MAGGNDQKNAGIIGCHRECLKIGGIKIDNPVIVGPAILKGAMQCVEKEIDWDLMAKKKVDRVVFQPAVPI